MQAKFLTNLFLILLLNLVVKPFYIFGIDANIQNEVGKVAYGNYFALLNFTYLFNILLDLGITNYNNRSIARNANKLQSDFSVILGVKLVLFLLYGLGCLILGVILDFSQDQWMLISWLMFNQFLISLILFVRSNLGGLQLFKRDSILSVLDRLLLIGICSILLWGGIRDQSFKIEWFICAQTIAYSITLFIGILLLPKMEASKWPRFKWKQSINILKRSAPFALLILLMMLYNRTDSVMLERLLSDGKEASGDYAMGYRILDASHMFVLLFGTLLLPMFSKAIKDGENINGLLEVSTRLLYTFLIPLVGVCAIFPQEILQLIYTDVNTDTVNSFRWLMIGFLGLSITYLHGALLTANGDLKLLNYMAISGFILNVSLNTILIPIYKSEGAAIATLVTQIVTGGIQFIYAQRRFKFPVLKSLVFPMITYMILITSILILWQYYTTWSLLKSGAFFIGMITISWMLGNLKLKLFLKEMKDKP